MTGHHNPNESQRFSHDDDDDLRGAAGIASRHAGDSGDAGLFGTILDTLGQRKQKAEIDTDDVNEAAAIKHHKKYFADDEDDGDEVDDRSMGTAAAMQALQMFTGRGDTPAGGKQSEFIGLALSEASKLFDKQAAQGKVSAGASKESAVMQAGEMALKFYMKSKTDAPGAGPGGGASGLMSMASQFLR